MTLTNQIEYRHVNLGQLETRLGSKDDGPGTFFGYANRYGVRDSYNTEFSPGCFTAGGGPDRRAYLWMHSPDEPVGVFTWREDDEGLWIEGTYDDTPEGQRARRRAASGSAAELSVGFIRRGVDPEDENRIVAAELIEVSQITLGMAAQPGAELTAVRKAAAEMERLAGNPSAGHDPEKRIAIDPPVGSYELTQALLREVITEWAKGQVASDVEIYVSIQATFSDHVIVTVYENWDKDTSFSFPYVLDNGGVTLGNATEVELKTIIAPVDSGDSQRASDADPETPETPDSTEPLVERPAPETPEGGQEQPDDAPDEDVDDENDDTDMDAQRMLKRKTAALRLASMKVA